uniref:Uncharacterized protein n=1 Tax=Parascaris equorum TaxID=6256 RepID=A0A914RDY3_PAREQ
PQSDLLRPSVPPRKGVKGEGDKAQLVYSDQVTDVFTSLRQFGVSVINSSLRRHIFDDFCGQ